METFTHLYDVFEMCGANGDHDLTITVAKFICAYPEKLSHGEQERAYDQFIGRHYEDLVEAYKAKDRAVFDAKVAELVAADLEQDK